MPRPRLAIFLSGSGRTLINIHDHILQSHLNAEIALVLASRECPAADRARERNLPTRIVPDNLSPDAFDQLTREHNADLVALAGYLRLVSFPPQWRTRVVNIHPALLPSFGGRGMFGRHVHSAVLRAGCKVSGCTVHFCDDRYDTGPIILQRCCPVLNDDTPDTLAARVFELEKPAYIDALRALTEGRVNIEDTPNGTKVSVRPPEPAS